MAQTETRRRVSDYSIDDEGPVSPQYWQGVSTSFTHYDDVYTGVGDNAREALENALDIAAVDGWDVDAIPNDMPETPTLCERCMEDMIAFGVDEEEDDLSGTCSCCEMAYYVILWPA
jgi:hypothetical protein